LPRALAASQRINRLAVTPIAITDVTSPTILHFRYQTFVKAREVKLKFRIGEEHEKLL
jgi:hypothetical protein